LNELTVAVLGAGGTIAPAVVRDLAESEETSGLTLLDVNEERATAVAREHGGPGPRVQVRAADARSGLAEQLSGHVIEASSRGHRVRVRAVTRGALPLEREVMDSMVAA
jgi:saccharopine dehydrogenase-like NADP-dependent oxidoreductase